MGNFDHKFASRAAEKLQFAIKTLDIKVDNLITADFGSSTGGFVDILLFNGAKKVYSIDTSYGELAYKLRLDPRVMVFERTNGMHVSLPEKVDLITVDTSWTKQEKIIPNTIRNLKETGKIITLVKPHYEASRFELHRGVTLQNKIPEILLRIEKVFIECNLKILNKLKSPIAGRKGGNEEWLYYLEINPN